MNVQCRVKLQVYQIVCRHQTQHNNVVVFLISGQLQGEPLEAVPTRNTICLQLLRCKQVSSVLSIGSFYWTP